MSADRNKDRDPFICPHCGAEVPADAPVCRECGSDAQTGWAEDADVGDADIPTGHRKDDEFDYDEFVEREFPDRAPASSRRRAKMWLWWIIIAVLVALVILYGFVR